MHQATIPLDLVVTQSGSFDAACPRLDKGILQNSIGRDQSSPPH
jgi:hypothetical protein